MNKISIALCTYNGAKFLPEQLESFIRQTRQPDELIVNDDCSTDETAQIIKNFARSAPFPVDLQINSTNLGSTKNFEQAISRCQGDLIFLSDQDDVWLPNKIEKMEKAFADQPDAGLFFSDAELTDEQLNPLNKKLWDFTFPPYERREFLSDGGFKKILKKNVVTGATMAFRSDLRPSFMPIPADVPNLIHDGWIALAVAANAKIGFLDEPLIKYRQHSNQQLGVNFQTTLKQNYEQRKKSFADSLLFYRNEEKRLYAMKKLLAENTAFKNLNAVFSTDELIEEKRQIAKHYKARMNLPLNRTSRLSPIAREFLTGRYHRFSKGYLSALKDLFEKW